MKKLEDFKGVCYILLSLILLYELRCLNFVVSVCGLDVKTALELLLFLFFRTICSSFCCRQCVNLCHSTSFFSPFL